MAYAYKSEWLLFMYVYVAFVLFVYEMIVYGAGRHVVTGC